MGVFANRWTFGAVTVLAIAVTGCGSSSPPVVRAPSGSGTSATTSTTAPTTPASSLHSATPGTQHATVTPAQGLTDRQHVQVRATGFTPGQALTVVQCADKGTSTGPADCNLANMLATSADSAGTVQVTLTVLRGPFGGNQIVCSQTQKCLISVTQASLSPSEEADAPISFAR